MAKKRRYVYKYVSADSKHWRTYSKERKIIKLFFCLVLLIIIAFLIYFGSKKLINLVYDSDKMTIKDIEIVKTKNITKAEIKELLPFKIGDNLLKINLSEAKHEIKKLKPELKNIVISRGWQKIKIRLYERTPEAFVTECDKIFGIDFDDTPFPLRGFMSKMKVPKLFCKSDSERKELLSFIKRFKSTCGDYISNISEMKFSNTKDIVFIMRDNTLVFWGNERPEDLSHKFNKFQKIYLDAISRYKRLEYIDMTFYDFGKAIVKPNLEETCKIFNE
jgi:cell division protein FtsQ